MDKLHTYSPEVALRRGSWVKFICGASNEDLPSISDLCAVYAAAGVNCIDVAADSAVVAAAREGLDWVENNHGLRPWLMISVNDGKDIHFRKAFFDPKICPKECIRPCEKICPTYAISKNNGVIEDLCYGCGRCIPICPLKLIQEKSSILKIEDFGNLISQIKPDAVEIHTGPGRINAFENSLKSILESKIELKRVSVSCGLEIHEISRDQLSQELWSRHECLRRYSQKPLWQLDGRPMSSDIGIGTGKAAVSLLEKMQSIAPPGPLQLAGGTNSRTINHLKIKNGLAGIAFGGIARKLIQPFLIEAKAKNKKLIDWPEGWHQALEVAKGLISPWLSNNYQIN